MATKRKTSKKQRTTKKPSAKAVKASVSKPVKPAAVPAAANGGPRWDIWVPLLVIVVPLVFSVLYIVNRPADKSTNQPSQSSSSSQSELRVVPEQGGSTASTQASGALQPQHTGLQQAQPTTQSAGGLNLQAQTTPSQTTIR